MLATTLFVLMLAWPAAATMRFELLTTGDGLAANTVRALAEDAQGFLWIGTEDGLNRFDGVEFTTYRSRADQPGALAEDYINCLLPDRDGSIWIGTFGGGLHRYVPRSGAFERYRHDPLDPASLSHDDVSALHQGADGVVWAGTRGGLNRIEAGVVQRIAMPADLQQGRLIADLAAAADGGLWVASQGGGLLHFDPRLAHWREEPIDDRGQVWSRELSALWTAPDGTLWVGSARSGLAKRTAQGSWTFRRGDGEDASLSDNRVLGLAAGRDGSVWIATQKGLDRLEPASGRIEHHRHAADEAGSLPFNDVTAVYEDQHGIVWVGTGGAGLGRHAPEPPAFRLYQVPPDAREGGAVWSVLETGPLVAQPEDLPATIDGGPPDSQRELVVGTLGRGLFRRHDGVLESWLPMGSVLERADVRGLLRARDGELWIGTRQGLHRLDPEGRLLRRYTHVPAQSDSLSHDFVRPLLEDARGTLWIGTYGGGLNRHDPARDGFVAYRHDPRRADSLSDDRVYSLLSAADGSLWVGTHGGGLNRLDANTDEPPRDSFKRYLHQPADPSSLAGDRVLALQQDRGGRIWIGTAAGLNRWRPEHDDFERFPALGERSICGIAEDASGALWLSRINGVLRFDPADASVHEYPLRGLVGHAELNCGVWNEAESGRIYFGGIAGVIEIDPSLWQVDAAPVRPVLTGFRLFNQAVPTRAVDADSPLAEAIQFAPELVLRHDQNVVGFSFAVIGSARPASHDFRYRLLGLDERWIEASARERVATFTRLPAGDYRFEVQARGADGAWTADAAAAAFTIRPAPWRSSWAYAGYLLLLGLLLSHFGWQIEQRRRLKRQAQQALRESEERLSLALWGSGDTLFDLDLDARSLLQIRGEHGEGFGMHSEWESFDDIRERVHPDDHAAFQATLARHLKGETESFELDCRIRIGDGGWQWRLIRGRVVRRDGRGRAQRMVGMQKDISPLKAVESELRTLNVELDGRVRARTEDLEKRQHELQQANARLHESLEELRRTQGELIEAEKMAALGQLVAGVAHEVNTPLGVALTASSHLHQETHELEQQIAEGKLTRARLGHFVTDASQSTDMIERNLNRAAHLVQSFKQVSIDRSSDGRRRFRLQEFLDDLLASMASQWKRRPLQIVVDCPDELVLDSFPGALGQVIGNLLQNALLHAFAAEQTGVIRIIAATAAGERIDLQLSDDGRGMSPSELEHVFEPFFTTRRGQGSTGLGLHIAFNLVTQKLGGTIKVSSVAGRGSVFTLSLPRSAPEQRAETTRDADAASG